MNQVDFDKQLEAVQIYVSANSHSAALEPIQGIRETERKNPQAQPRSLGFGLRLLRGSNYGLSATHLLRTHPRYCTRSHYKAVKCPSSSVAGSEGSAASSARLV